MGKKSKPKQPLSPRKHTPPSPNNHRHVPTKESLTPSPAPKKLTPPLQTSESPSTKQNTPEPEEIPTQPVQPTLLASRETDQNTTDYDEEQVVASPSSPAKGSQDMDGNKQLEVATNPNPKETTQSTSSPLRGLKTWVTVVQPQTLKKQGQAYTLPSGEACVKIPNFIIEKHKRDWDCFIIGQFYSDPPSQGVIHNVVNGIWSRGFRDITVSRMEGSSFLFRIPNGITRKRVLTQRLWQIAGQTLFVDKWEPGLIPSKPELTAAPLWIEFRDIPLQFFNEDGLEQIASLVGEPKEIHPTTAAKTNLTVAKVLTIIDPRVPLPEAVNVQFESGEIRRVRVSSPWMPHVCSFCKELGHTIRNCKKAPVTCADCNSTTHEITECPRMKRGQKKSRPQATPRMDEVGKIQAKTQRISQNGQVSTQENVIEAPLPIAVVEKEKDVEEETDVIKSPLVDTGTGADDTQESDEQRGIDKEESLAKKKGKEIVADPDSSDVSSNDSRETDWYENIRDFKMVLSKRQQKQLRGKGLTIA